MRYALMTEPQQGYSYQDILDAANAAKAAGFETLLPLGPLLQLPGRGGAGRHGLLDHAGGAGA